jgi:4-amino-4-deoxy-L-arabinose transferase-like glycosyltransferase
LTVSIKRLAEVAWILFIAAFALVHFMHLSADFPNHTPWFMDWAKYTDEGWYGNAAIRAHLFGNWYMTGDFNPAPAVPVWPFLEWLLFFFTGVSLVAARALTVGFFVINLVLSYLLLRVRGARWMALLALTLIVTSPFLYAFSRLAILEPMLTAFLLAALNLAIRLPRLKRPIAASIGIGLLFTLMLLSKTSAAFLLPALGWAIAASFGKGTKWWMPRREAIRCAVAAGLSAAVSFGLWMALVIASGLLTDYRYLFFINKYIKPKEFYWPLVSLWWSFHGGLWVDHVLIPLAGVVFLLVLATYRSKESKKLLSDPLFGSSVLAAAGYILFMTYQNHPQPRYFTVVGIFSIFVLAQGVEALMNASKSGTHRWVLWLGTGAIAVSALAAGANAVTTLSYATHPEYSWVTAARNLTHYVDQHPNGKRLVVSISGDEMTMITHLPTMCDDFGTMDFADRLGAYQPGWWAGWNSLDPGTLEDLHTHYSLEQVASFPAFDDPDRNVLVLFKLHPLPGGKIRENIGRSLRVKLPDDRFTVSVDAEDE